jgi:hypothetical protein
MAVRLLIASDGARLGAFASPIFGSALSGLVRNAETPSQIVWPSE